MPEYFNLPLDSVTADLIDRGLVFTTVAEENANVAYGNVHRTDPPAGQLVLENSSITVFFNPDPQLRNVPQVRGIALADAIELLES